MSVDLSKELTKKREPLVKSQPERIPMVQRKSNGNDRPGIREAKSWQRGAGYVRRGSVGARMVQDSDEDDSATQEEERQKYEEMKKEYSLWTTVTAAVCFTAICTFYTRVRSVN
jgi:hypothetical protein